MKLTGARAVELIKEAAEFKLPGVEVYWFNVESRTAFSEEIVAVRNELPIFPLAVTRGFTDGNTLGEDLVQLIIQNQFAFLGVPVTHESHVVLALVSREPLRVPQVSSPLELPSWFPGFGGTQLNVEIKDYRRSLLTSLKSPEARVPRLHALMHMLDTQMLRLLEADRALDPILQLVQRPASADGKKERHDPPRLSDFKSGFVAGWRAIVAGVSDPEGYRLEMAKEGTLAARLVGFVGKTGPDSLGKLASHVATALQLGSDVPKPLYGLLWRPLPRETEIDRIAGRQLLILMYAAHQYTTAAAHADQYPSYPVALLQSVSEELISSLATFVEQLESRAPHTPQATESP